MSNPSNPNGANQYQADPRQKFLWDSYVDPNSETFGNALRSAIKAGYTEGTATQITKENWFIEKLRRLNLLNKAEQKLNEVLDLPVYTLKGETDKGVIDVAKFIASTQGKHVGYSTRQEVTAADGAELKATSINIINPNGNNLPSIKETI